VTVPRTASWNHGGDFSGGRDWIPHFKPFPNSGVPALVIHAWDGGEHHMITGGPGGYDPAALSGLDGRVGYLGAMGGFWGSVGNFFKKVGGGIYSAGKKAVDLYQKNEGTIKQWIDRLGGAAAVKQGACIYDSPCDAYYILQDDGGGAVTFQVAQQGQCVGRTIYNGSEVPGWGTPCQGGATQIGQTIDQTISGNVQLAQAGAWFSRNWLTVAGVLAGLMVVKSITRKKSKRKKRKR